MKTILVLDDEFNLLNLVCRLLQRHGYRTIQTSNAAETLRLSYDDLRLVDLFVVDVCLAEGSGIQVAVELRADLPTLPILLVSGYPINGWSIRDSKLFGKLGPNTVRILQKPFTPQILMATIGEIVGPGRVGRANSA
jgi:DNA-binding response OmpR family regulator